MRLSPNIKTEIKNTLYMLGVGTSIFVGYSIYNGNQKFYYKVLIPAVHLTLSAENSHRLGIFMGKYNLFPKFSVKNCDLNIKVFGLNFSHPVGVAAGFDKHGEAVLGLLGAGFSFVEVGSVTPKPQPGNSHPRVFRLQKDEAVINRYGFNSDGHASVYERLCNINWKDKGGIVGVNLGVNKDSENFIQDYVDGVKRFGDICDYLVINVSSPNTKDLRELQKYKSLRSLVIEVMKARNTLSKRTPVLLKISPDESDKDIEDIIKLVMEHDVDGLVVSNSTLSRNNLLSDPVLVGENGGLSGKPLADRSTELIARISSLTNRKVVIIGVGGIDSGQEAWKKIMAGATLVQLYTSMVYYGPPVVRKVVMELHNELRKSDCVTYQELIANRDNFMN